MNTLQRDLRSMSGERDLLLATAMWTWTPAADHSSPLRSSGCIVAAVSPVKARMRSGWRSRSIETAERGGVVASSGADAARESDATPPCTRARRLKERGEFVASFISAHSRRSRIGKEWSGCEEFCYPFLSAMASGSGGRVGTGLQGLGA